MRSNIITVFVFLRNNEIQIVLVIVIVNLFFRNGSTIASYEVLYNLKALYDNLDDIVDDISSKVYPELKRLTINGTEIDNGYLNASVTGELNDGRLYSDVSNNLSHEINHG